MRHILSQAPWQVRLWFFFVGTHLPLSVLMAVGPVDGPGHPSCLHFYSQLPGSSGRKGFGLPSEPHFDVSFGISLC